MVEELTHLAINYEMFFFEGGMQFVLYGHHAAVWRSITQITECHPLARFGLKPVSGMTTVSTWGPMVDGGHTQRFLAVEGDDLVRSHGGE